jgi:hypothetical protein
MGFEWIFNISRGVFSNLKKDSRESSEGIISWATKRFVRTDKTIGAPVLLQPREERLPRATCAHGKGDGEGEGRAGVGVHN